MFTKNNLKTNAVAEAVAKILEAELDEALKGGQKKIDKNHNGKLDAQDFKMLRGEKPVEEVEGVAEGLVKDIKRLATGKDVKSRAGQEIAKSQDASMKGDNKTAYKHFKRYDKLDKLANEEAALGVPIKGHPYHKKTDAELRYIQKDAAEAAKAMQGHAPKSEAKYLDQVNDASTVLHYRSKGGKQLAKEEVEELDELSKNTLSSYASKAGQRLGGNIASLSKTKEISKFSANPTTPDEVKNRLQQHISKRTSGLADASKRLAKEEVEKPTHIVSKELLSDHKRWMDSEGFDTHTVPLPKSHPKHATHVGIVAKNNNEAGYHEDGFARPIKESVESIDEISTAQMGHAGKTTLKHIKNPGVGLRMAAHDVKPGIKGYRDRVDLMKAADAEGKLKKEEAEDLEEKKGDSDLGTFTDNNMGEMTDAQMKKRETIVKGMKKGLAGFKERYGKRAKDVMYATATKQAMKDEAIDPNAKTTDTLAGRIKGGESNLHTSYKVKLKTEAMGCENTPMSRATNLAKAAYKKLKNETMMGKAGGTSEEKE